MSQYSLDAIHSSGPRLLADIGGTNARFAWQAGPQKPLEALHTLSCAAYKKIEDAIQAYLDICNRPTPSNAAIAIANPVHGDNVKMTNHHWSFSISSLKETFKFKKFVVLNDFTATALALPTIDKKECIQVGGREAFDNAAIGLLGPGTGLGVSGLLPNGRGGWTPIQGEGGHVTLPAVTPREQLVLNALQKKYGHGSAERAISGMGLSDIYTALAQADGIENSLSAAEITQAAYQGNPRAIEALEMMCSFLGTVAGNLALTLGAKGGIYIAGGIIPKISEFFVRSSFRKRFEDKGRFRPYLEEIPVWIIMSEISPALNGAAIMLDQTKDY